MLLALLVVLALLGGLTAFLSFLIVLNLGWLPAPMPDEWPYRLLLVKRGSQVETSAGSDSGAGTVRTEPGFPETGAVPEPIPITVNFEQGEAAAPARYITRDSLAGSTGSKPVHNFLEAGT